MLLVKAIVRPEKTTDIINALYEAGFPAITKMDVSGRGRQRGEKGGDFFDSPPFVAGVITIMRLQAQRIKH